jgi:hypothetical protein
MNVIISGIIILFVIFFFCLLFKISSKISVAVSLLFIAVSAGILVNGDTEMANDLATITYFMLIASVALVVVENIKDIRQEQPTEGEDGN